MHWLSKGVSSIKKWFKRPAEMETIPPAKVKDMLTMLEQTREKELSCDETHGLLGEYVEMEMSGEDAARMLSLVHHHLEMCPDCREEYEALAGILKAQIS